MAQGRYGGECVSGHTAMIFDRGGTRRLGPVLDLSRVEWNRVRDGISDATIRIEGDACSKQREFLDSIRSHRHELVLFRGEDRVWEGPINRAGSHGTYFEVNAHDVIDYLMATPLTQGYDNSYPNLEAVTTRIGDIILYELAATRVQKNAAGVDVTVPAWESLDPPVNVAAHLVVHNFPNEARTSAVTLPYQMTVGEHLKGLARVSGIDYTAVGRAIHIWDVSRSIGRIETWTEKNVQSDVKITEYGADHAQSAYTVGADGLYGSAINEEWLDYYGPWTKIFTAYDEATSLDAPSQEELDEQSRRNINGRSPVPIEVRIPDNSTVILTETLTIRDLVPGVQVPLRATLNARNLVQLQKIDAVRVIETPQGETVSVTLTPATKPDEDEEEV